MKLLQTVILHYKTNQEEWTNGKNYENENKAKNYSTDKTSDKNAMDSRNSSKNSSKNASRNSYGNKHPMHMTKSRMIILARY